MRFGYRLVALVPALVLGWSLSACSTTPARTAPHTTQAVTSASPEPGSKADLDARARAWESRRAESMNANADYGKLRYSASGTGQIDITYTDAAGQISQAAGVRGPWVKTMGSGGDFYTISVQNMSGSGYASCEIYVDGNLVTSNRSDGGYTIAECDYPS